MKIIIVATILVVSAIVVNGHEQGPQPDSHTSDSQNQKNKDLHPIPSQMVIVVNQQAADTKKDSSESKTQNYLYELVSPVNIPNIALVIVAIVGIVVAIRTLKKMERQTTATETAANAAKISADSLKALERADVLLTSVCFNPETLSEQSIRFEIINVGRSRAENVSIAIAIHASKDPNRIDWSDVGKASLLAPGRSFELLTTRISQWIEQLTDIKNNLIDLRFDGAIQFTDIFGQVTWIVLRGQYDPTHAVFTFTHENSATKIVSH